MFDENRALRLNLGSALGVIPHEECAWGVREGNVRDVALITRVGRTVCFTVQELDETKQPPWPRFPAHRRSRCVKRNIWTFSCPAMCWVPG